MSRITFGRELRTVIANALSKIATYYNTHELASVVTLSEYESIDHSNDPTIYLITDGCPELSEERLTNLDSVYFRDSEILSICKEDYLLFKKSE
jgi:hypothetical protein